MGSKPTTGFSTENAIPDESALFGFDKPTFRESGNGPVVKVRQSLIFQNRGVG